MRKVRSRRLALIGFPILAVAALGLWYARAERPGRVAPVAGVVRVTEIHVAPEISGRLSRFLVKPGETVQVDQPLALLDNPELWAAVGEARAQVDKAMSDRDRIYAGVRREEVETLQREIFKAQATEAYARQELARKSALVARSDVSVQDLDDARAEAARSEADVAVAQARYAEAQLGPTAEERALADAQVKAAQAARDVIEARAAKMLLRAPAAGTIGIRVPEIGEAVVPGETVLTLIPGHGLWFGFNLREDALGALSVGSPIVLRVSGSDETVPATVTELRNWGEFATWRAARAVGDHDLNTFFLRLDPSTAVPTLAAGQTVWLQAGGD